MIAVDQKIINVSTLMDQVVEEKLIFIRYYMITEKNQKNNNCSVHGYRSYTSSQW